MVVAKKTKKDLEKENETLRDSELRASIALTECENRINDNIRISAEKDTKIANLEADLAQERLLRAAAEEDNSLLTDARNILMAQGEFLIRGIESITSYAGPSRDYPTRLAQTILDGITAEDDDDV